LKVPFRHIEPLLSDAFLRGDRIRISVTGTSMQPWIKGGDLLELEAVDSDRVRVGEVVLAKRQDETHVLHRVVKLQDDRVMLRGDAQNTHDEPFPRCRVIARVVSVKRGRRVFHLDRGLWRFMGSLWVMLSPVGPVVYNSVCAVRRRTRHLLAGL
jgi:hypothetical protein